MPISCSRDDGKVRSRCWLTVKTRIPRSCDVQRTYIGTAERLPSAHKATPDAPPHTHLKQTARLNKHRDGKPIVAAAATRSHRHSPQHIRRRERSWSKLESNASAAAPRPDRWPTPGPTIRQFTRWATSSSQAKGRTPLSLPAATQRTSVLAPVPSSSRKPSHTSTA